MREQLHRAIAEVDADAGVVALVVGRALVRVASLGHGLPGLAAWPLPLTAGGPLADATAAARSVWIGDDAELRARYPDLAPVPDVRAGGFVPVVADGRTLGVVGVMSSRPHRWTGAERSRIEEAAAGLARPLARMDAAERRRTVAAQLVALRAEPSVQARLDRAARLIAGGLGSDLVVVALASPDGEWLERFGIHHPDPAAEQELRRLTGPRLRVGEVVSATNTDTDTDADPDEAAATGDGREAAPILDHDLGGVGRLAPFFERWPVRASLTVPVFSARRPEGATAPQIGLVTVLRGPTGPYLDADDRRFLDELTPLVAALAPTSGDAPAGPDAGRLPPLAGRPAGLVLAAAVPLAVSALLGPVPGSQALQPGALYLAGVTAVAVAAGRRAAVVSATLSLVLFRLVAVDGTEPGPTLGAMALLAACSTLVVLLVDRLERAARSLVELERRQADRRHLDATERLAAAEGRALADSRLRSLVEATTAVTWRSDPAGDLIEPQPDWEAFTGQPWTEHAGQGWAEMVHPDDRGDLRAAWDQARASGGVLEHPLRLWSATHGEHRHTMTRAVPLRDRHGRVVEWIGAVTDVHERVLAQRDAERTAALLDTLTRQAPVGFGFIDTDGRYRLVNDQLACIDGCGESDHLGRRPEEVSAASAALAPLVRRVLTTGGPALDVTVPVGPGAPAPCTAPPRELVAGAYPVRAADGGLLGVGTTVVEVTEQRRLARELSETRARLAGLMEANVLACIFGEDDRITHANDAFLRLVGRSRADLEAGRLEWPALTAPGWERADRAALDQLDREGRADAYEKEYLTADGSPVPVEIGVVAIDRRPLRWTAYVVDLRERKAVERRLREARDQRDSVARTLQTSLLPPTLPQPEGLRFAARYLPSPVGEGVGGDFYDVYRTHTGNWHVVIGDVCGRGSDAAALTALTRYTLRAAAIDEDDPAEILRVLNDAVRSSIDDGRFCTVAYLVLSPVSGTLRGGPPAWWRATLTLGGHHPPRILRRGTMSTPGRPGTLIGAFPTARFDTVELGLAPGDIVVTFTDGLIEQPDPRFSEADLDDLLRRLAAERADLDVVMAALEEHVAPEIVRDDDTAILAFEVR